MDGKNFFTKGCSAAAQRLPPGLKLAFSHRQLRTTVGNLSFYDAFKSNLQAATLVALVSLALSIGLGIASGSTPISGLRTAIWGGIACGIFGSSPFNIIGPAGALSGMLNTYSAPFPQCVFVTSCVGTAPSGALTFFLGSQSYRVDFAS